MWSLLKELTADMNKRNMKVLWTCRTEEANLFGVGKTEIKLLDLPHLDRTQCKTQARKLLENPNFNTSLSKSPELLEPVWVAMLINFPIINMYMRKDDQLRRPASSFGGKILEGLEKLKIGTDDTPANPVVWVMNQLNNMLPMDVMYELVVEKITEELSSRTRFDADEIEGHWEEYVEGRFYDAALTKHDRYGSRLIVSNTITGLKPEIHALVNEFHTAGERYGILKKVNQTIHFTHQLFAEYVVFKTIKAYGGVVDRHIGRFPSMKIRHAGYATDPTCRSNSVNGSLRILHTVICINMRDLKNFRVMNSHTISQREPTVRDKFELWEEDVNDEKRALFKKFTKEYREYPLQSTVLLELENIHRSALYSHRV